MYNAVSPLRFLFIGYSWPEQWFSTRGSVARERHRLTCLHCSWLHCWALGLSLAWASRIARRAPESAHQGLEWWACVYVHTFASTWWSDRHRGGRNKGGRKIHSPMVTKCCFLSSGIFGQKTRGGEPGRDEGGGQVTSVGGCQQAAWGVPQVPHRCTLISNLRGCLAKCKVVRQKRHNM